MLKVININSPIDLTRYDCGLIEDIFYMAEKVPHWEGDNSMSYLIRNIPIFLISQNEDEETKWDFDNPPTEYLGYYTIKKFQEEGEFPAIFIDPGRIYKFREKTEYQPLLAAVIVHEFAHAIMDRADNGKFPAFYEKGNTYSTSDFIKWVEEAFANWFVLKYFHAYGNGDYFNKIVNFIKGQPEGYKQGIDFFKMELKPSCWKEWCEEKKKFKEMKKFDFNRFVKIYIKNKNANNIIEYLKTFPCSKLI